MPIIKRQGLTVWHADAYITVICRAYIKNITKEFSGSGILEEALETASCSNNNCLDLLVFPESNNHIEQTHG